MKPLSEFPVAARANIRCVLTDIDDTLSTHGRLTAQAYAAMEQLREAGYLVIPVTGRPAGWCDHIARMWPVDAVVGENGALYMRHDDATRKLNKRFVASEAERSRDRKRLLAIAERIVREIPGCALASDQQYRETDIAIDYCEDVAPLSREAVDRIVAMMRAEGMSAKVSSIHVNGWFGSYDKLAMTRILLADEFAIALDREERRCIFIGDSPNDSPMFGFFSYSIGVANVQAFRHAIPMPPKYLTVEEAGSGFAEVAALLLG
ncbi:MAG: HAD-IIB family hydrolase [Pseudomonadota bacterium]|nr:HAD-IIB family hydrolase [Pseudomonadota bacterium]